MKKPPFLYLVIPAIILIVAAVCWGFFEAQEMSAYDWLISSRPKQTPSASIAIIEISDDTLNGLGRWPLPRNYHAALINALTDSGCKMIVFDILLSEPSKEDDLLAQAIADSGRVYLPYAFNLDKKSFSQKPLPVAKEILGGVAEKLKPPLAGIGHINITIDSDGKVRKIPAQVISADKLYPALGLLAASKYLGISLEKIKIPVDAQSNFWVNYPGSWTETFQHYSYLDVLKAKSALQTGAVPWLDLGVFKDKICFVGLTATGTSDFRANPIEPVYPMIGLQASLCDSVIRNNYIRRSSPLARVSVDIIILLIALWICFKFFPLKAFLSCLSLSIIYIGSVWFIFYRWGVFTDVFLPLLSIAVIYVVALFYRFLLEVQKKFLLEKELETAASIQSSFLPPDVHKLKTVNIRAFLKPAKFVAGDFYDIIRLDESTVGVFIADVCGKGVSAALIMAQAISLLRVIARDSRDPAKVLALLNEQLGVILGSRFITGQYIVIHENGLFFEGACAGHPALLFLNNEQKAVEELFPASGAPLGLEENVSYVTAKRQFNPGDKIFMYTDGWTDNFNLKGKEFGINSIKNILINAQDQGADGLLSSLYASYNIFKGQAEQFDDLTAVIVDFIKPVTKEE